VWKELAHLGLDEREARFYVAVLALGQTTVAKASAEARVTRTSGYDIARRLTDRNLLQAISYGDDGRREDGTRTGLTAVDPQEFFREIEERQRSAERLIPQLRAIQSSAPGRPKVRYLEGHSGIRTALFETLKWPSPLLGIFAMKDLFLVPGAGTLADYVQGRKDHHLALQVVRSRERDIPDQWLTSRQELRETRYAPERYVFTMTTIIGKDTVAVISSREEEFAMMIDSREYARTQSFLFDSLWQASIPAPRVDT
jgi:sugar-specific transcriptional regulator TrmB